MTIPDSIKLFVGVNVPVYSCNFRCQYCYLSHHDEAYKGKTNRFGKSISKIVDVFDPEKVGGFCYFNFCGFGETLLHPDVVDLVAALLDKGHYADIITNGTISKQLSRLIYELNDSQKEHLLVKFSFHYLQLKEKGLLEEFCNNINLIKQSGISISIEITPHDELIPYIPEIIAFSKKRFSALPHITVARNESTKQIELLSKYSKEELSKIWGEPFNSKMFDFKLSVFGEKRAEFCYAGLWSIQLDPGSGDYWQCYVGNKLGNVFNQNKLRLIPICKCREPHCFNAHAFMTFGLLPDVETPKYIEMRDRVESDGTHWINKNAVTFLSSQFIDSCFQLNEKQKRHAVIENSFLRISNFVDRCIKKIKKVLE